MRMFGGRNKLEQLSDRLSKRNIEDQKMELENIKKAVENNEFTEMEFDCVLIGNADAIFPPANQQNYWNSKTRIIEMNLPHYPFDKFKSWKEIINI